jgi:hypothetical protein
MYGKYASALKLGLVADGVWVCMSVSIWRERHRCKRNDHHHRPELGAVKRHTHKSSGRSAHRCKRKNSRHRVSQAKMRRQKVSDTAIYTGTAKGTAQRTKRHSYSQRHRQRAHAHKRQKGTGTVIGTETGNVMAQGRYLLKGHSHTGTRQQQKGHLHRKGHIHKHSKKS